MTATSTLRSTSELPPRGRVAVVGLGRAAFVRMHKAIGRDFLAWTPPQRGTRVPTSEQPSSLCSPLCIFAFPRTPGFSASEKKQYGQCKTHWPRRSASLGACAGPRILQFPDAAAHVHWLLSLDNPASRAVSHRLIISLWQTMNEVGVFGPGCRCWPMYSSTVDRYLFFADESCTTGSKMLGETAILLIRPPDDWALLRSKCYLRAQTHRCRHKISGHD